ncbi:hypothetical protein KI387_018807, partial [Taxus chinensis]
FARLGPIHEENQLSPSPGSHLGQLGHRKTHEVAEKATSRSAQNEEKSGLSLFCT